MDLVSVWRMCSNENEWVKNWITLTRTTTPASFDSSKTLPGTSSWLGDSKLPTGMNISVNGCLSLNVSPAINWHLFGVPWLTPKAVAKWAPLPHEPQVQLLEMEYINKWKLPTLSLASFEPWLSSASWNALVHSQHKISNTEVFL